MKQPQLHESKLIKNFLRAVFAVLVIILSLCLNDQYVLAADEDIVYIPDEKFKNLLNKKLNVEDITADITEGQLATIKELRISSEVVDITGIEKCINLTDLQIVSDGTVNIKDIEKLKNLTGLNINSNEITNTSLIYNYSSLISLNMNVSEGNVDLSGIDKLTNLLFLTLKNVKCNDYSPISKLQNVVVIQFNECDIKALPELSACENFQELNCIGCKSLTDISGLADVEYLLNVKFKDCEALTDISPLKDMSITNLVLEKVKITNSNKTSYMETIASIKNLESLSLISCGITSTYATMLEKLYELTILDLTDNDINNLYFLDKLRYNVTYLYLSDNNITDFYAQYLSSMKVLSYLDVGKNNITDYSFVAKIPKLSNYTADTYENLSELVFGDASEIVINNIFKDEKGNIVAPKESEQYTYNEKTQEITIFLDKCVDNKAIVEYDFKVTGYDGDEFYVTHSKIFNLVKAKKTKDVRTYLNLDVTLSFNFVQNSTYEYQWYKDGKIIEGATKNKYDIKGAQSSDEGKYTLKITTPHRTVTSEEITVIVNPYEELKASFEVIGVKESMSACVGDEISIKVSAQGGKGEYTYHYYGKMDNSWPETVDSTSNIMGPEKITTSGKLYFSVQVSDSDGNKVSAGYVNLVIYEKITSALEVNGFSEDLVVYEGENVELKALAEGGSGVYTYTYSVYNKDTGKSFTLARNIEAASYIWEATTAGNRLFYVQVKDSAGNVVKTSSAKIEVKKHTLTMDDTVFKRIKYLNDKFELKVNNANTSLYKYKYVIEDIATGKTFTLKNFTSDSSVSGTFTVCGNKKIIVYVKDSDGNIVETNSIFVTVYDAPLSGELVVTNCADNSVLYNDAILYVDDRVEYTVTAKGGNGEYTYDYFHIYQYENGGRIYSYSVSKNIEDNKYKCRVGNENVHWFCVKIKDGDGNEVLTNPIRVIVCNPLEVNGSASATAVVVGDEVTITAKADGGSYEYTYSFIVYNKDTKKWARVANNISSNKFVWQPGSAGDRTFYVDVKDSIGNTVRSEAIYISVSDELSVKGNISATDVSIGDELILTAKAGGGTGNYTYSYIVYNRDTKKWARLADNITSDTFVWKAKNKGNRVFYVDVKDSTGKVVRSNKINVSVK